MEDEGKEGMRGEGDEGIGEEEGRKNRRGEGM